jgi:hypothetical protein
VILSTELDVYHQVVVWVTGTVIGGLVLILAMWMFRKPGRWLWRTLISAPVAAWFRREVGDEIDEKIQPLTVEVGNITEQLRATNGDRASLSDRLDKVKATGIKSEQRLDSLEQSHAEIKAHLPPINP